MVCISIFCKGFITHFHLQSLLVYSKSWLLCRMHTLTIFMWGLTALTWNIVNYYTETTLSYILKWYLVLYDTLQISPWFIKTCVKSNVMSDCKIKGSHANNGCLGFYEIDVNLPAILFIRIHTPQLCSLIYRSKWAKSPKQIWSKLFCFACYGSTSCKVPKHTFFHSWNCRWCEVQLDLCTDFPNGSKPLKVFQIKILNHCTLQKPYTEQ